MQAFTFSIRFETAQFRRQDLKLYRQTYLVPPPSAVAGVFSAILGIPKRRLKRFCLKNVIYAGAELVDVGGYSVGLARIYKFKEKKEAISTIKRSEELYRPKYKFAIASKNGKLIEKGMEQVKCLNFEYDVFGGNDYHLAEEVSQPRKARFYKSRIGRGCCPADEFKKIISNNATVIPSGSLEYVRTKRAEPLIIPASILADVQKRFIFVFGADVEAKSELNVVDDGKSKVFVYKSSSFLVERI